MSKTIFLIFIIFFIGISAYTLATYPVFYDASGKEVNLNLVQNLSNFNLSTIYLDSFLIKPLIPTPQTDEDYLLYYGCARSKACIENYINANILKVSLELPNTDIFLLADSLLKCREKKQLKEQQDCLKAAGIKIKSYQWHYMTTNKEGDLNV